MTLDTLWYHKHPARFLLLPFSGLFCALATLRRRLYRHRILRSWRAPVPVIVVGNISVGGTGKTPLVIFIANYLRDQGWRPGIVSRGYQGKAQSWPQAVEADSDPRLVGDEPVVLAMRSGCPVRVAPQRRLAVEALLPDCDIIICDDGLQHYALQRDVEIAVLDGARGLGNGLCLPAGPLREPPGRLQTVDLRIARDGHPQAEFAFHYHLSGVWSLGKPDDCQTLAYFRGQLVHAVAGIGNPRQFFASLEEAGLQVIPHAFPDHADYCVEDFAFGDDLPILMTEKDAVKCGRIPNAWAVQVRIEVAAGFTAALMQCLTAGGAD